MNIMKINQMKVDKIPLEVKLEDGGYYTVFVESLNETEAIITFENWWHSVMQVPYEDLRLARQKTIRHIWLAAGMEIDANDCSVHHRYKGYWKGVITNLREGYGHVRFEERADNLYKIIPTKDLCFMNSSPPLRYDNFYTFTFTIEQKYDDCLETSLPLLKATLGNAVTITYSRTSENLILRSPFMKCIERAEIFKSTFLKSIENKYRVMRRLQKIRNKIRITQAKGYLQIIEFDNSLTSYILRQGKHYLRSARNIDGISFISIHNDPSRFIVFGETKGALIKASRLLQYVQEHIFVPQWMLLQFIGENNSTLCEAITMHDLAQILIPKHLPFNNIPRRKNETACILVGINQNVFKAKLYLESHLNRLKERFDAELSNQLLVILSETSNFDSTSESYIDVEDSEIEISQQESQTIEQLEDYELNEDEEVQDIQSNTTVAVSQTCEQLNVTPTTSDDSNSPSANESEETPPSTSQVTNEIAPLTDAEENSTSSEHLSCSFATESTVNMYFQSTTADDDSIMEDDIKITLIGWILKTGYHGPLLEKVALNFALHEKKVSAQMMQLICSITDEIQSLCNLNEILEPFEEDFLFEVFSGQLFSLLREMECPYAALFKGIVKRRLQCKCRKKLLLKYLISELLCARLLNSPHLIYNMRERLRHNPKEIQRNKLLKVINIPCYPSQKTMALLSSQLNISSFENNADVAEESQLDDSDSDGESSELERKNKRLKARVAYLENFILSMQGAHLEMQREHPEMQINPDFPENMQEELDAQNEEFLDHLYDEVSDEEDNENLENNDNEQEAEEIPQDPAAAGDIGLINDDVPQQIVNRGAGDELEE